MFVWRAGGIVYYEWNKKLENLNYYVGVINISTQMTCMERMIDIYYDIIFYGELHHSDY